MPSVNMINNVIGGVMTDSNEEFQPNIMSHRELKKEINTIVIPSKVPYDPLLSLTY